MRLVSVARPGLVLAPFSALKAALTLAVTLALTIVLAPTAALAQADTATLTVDGVETSLTTAQAGSTLTFVVTITYASYPTASIGVTSNVPYRMTYRGLSPCVPYTFLSGQTYNCYSGAAGSPGQRSDTINVTVDPAAPPGDILTTFQVSLADGSYLDLTHTTRVVAAPPPSTVPTLTEWAMILLGTMLAGGTALYLQRRQRTS